MSLLDPILGPLLLLNPLIAIFIISFVISLTMVLVYKRFTDQDLMKRLKNEIKELQAEMKALKDKPEKMMEVQKRAMETNSKYMMHSMKPTLFTIIPIFLIFGWLNGHMAYWPIMENSEFSITAQFEEADGTISLLNPPDGITVLNGLDQEILDDKADWVLQGRAGSYTLDYSLDGQEFSHSLIITTGQRSYAKPVLREKDLGIKDTGLDTLTISNKKVQPLQQIPLVKSIPWVGNWGWLGTYILFSITFSVVLRRWLKVY